VVVVVGVMIDEDVVAEDGASLARLR